MSTSSQSLKEAVAAYANRGSIGTAESLSLLEKCYRALVDCRDVDQLRAELALTWDFSLPVPFLNALHVHILAHPQAQPTDWLAFADFLSSFYPEFDPWGVEIRRLHGARQG
jgi:hypothetical protein